MPSHQVGGGLLGGCPKLGLHLMESISEILWVINLSYVMSLFLVYCISNLMDTLRASHAFLCVDSFVDKKRVGGHGKFMRIVVETTCEEVLAQFMQSHTPDYLPLAIQPTSFSHVQY